MTAGTRCDAAAACPGRSRAVIALVQRVAEARVVVGGATAGAIGRGLLVFVCAEPADGEAQAVRLVDKLLKLRIFGDAAGRMNRSLQDVGGGLLVVSQFTLAADTRAATVPALPARPRPRRAARSTRRCCGWRASGTRWSRPASSVPTCRCTWSTTGR
jgi:D-tyrosyl-tRNA(Tyr) deacylase